MANQDKILMSHGSGGSMMSDLIEAEFVNAYIDKDLYLGDDATVLDKIKLNDGEKIAMSTDSYVVHPLTFPGADIGRLAVCGTVNDISTSGAKPIALSIGFILEEGLEISVLKEICSSIAKSATEAGVKIVTGDTKVVEHGKCDGIYINTSGIGIVPNGINLSGQNIKPGDVVLISGTIGDHGITIMSCREGLNFSTNLKSDAAPLNSLVADVLKAAPDTRCFRDPTRGGVASALNEFAAQSNVDITINEVEVSLRREVKSACEMLGYDVFQVANEGKMIAIVPPDQADAALSAMRANKYGKESAIIGYVDEVSSSAPKVYVQTEFKTRRILDKLVGEQLPRIC